VPSTRPRPARRGLARIALVAALGAAATRAGAADDRTPYQLRPALDLSVTAGLFLAAGAPYLFPHLITPSCPCDPGEVNRFDRVAIGHHSAAASTASDVTAALSVAVPPVVDALRLGLGAPFAADVTVFAETLAVSSALVVAAKYAVRRPLPLAYDGDPRYVGAQGGYRSFYSGHTSTVVSALTAAAWTTRWRDGERGWPWVVVAVAGTSVGVERVLAGRHFPSDVLVGAAAGLAVGTAVPWLHRRRGAVALSLAPRPGGAVLTALF
jgi:membrane-associated phospholipid phosphatase